MDPSRYLPMFLAEAREQLQALSLALVRLEHQPQERAILDEVFRITHSFKGMSATMGFEQLAQVSHEMEEVLELLRSRQGGLDRRVADVLMECLDALEQAVSSLEAGEGEKVDVGRLTARLRSLTRRSEEEDRQPESAKVGASPGSPALHVRVRLRDEAAMPGVRAFQALQAVADHGRLLCSRPDRRGIETFAGREVEAWVQTDHPPGLVEGSLRALSEIASVEIEAVEPESVPPWEDDRRDADLGRDFSGTAAVKAGRTVRIDADRLDQLMHLMGEVVVHRTRVESLVAELGLPVLQRAVQDLARSSQALQGMIMQARMIPIEAVFLRFPRVVRDLAGQLGKEVDLVLAGQETELDRTVVEALGDPLVHLVRNALDHGLETPDERAAAGKPRAGRLEIAARHAGGSVVITVSDDGRGIDPSLVARRAAEQGLIPPQERESVDTARAIELLFEPGFSTATETTDLSGRGVGMDAVRTAVRALGGEVSIRSQQGLGTTACIRLPLTLAIVAVLLVAVEGDPFAIPLDRVERTLALSDYPVRSVAGRRVVVLRDRALPLLDGAEALGRPRSHRLPRHGVVVQSGDERAVLAVEYLIGQRELVTRSLPDEVGNGAPVSGAAVLSDGAIALIVDCDALVRPRPLVNAL